MAHGDERGLKLPPKVAPIQVIVVPVAMHKEGVLEKAEKIKQELLKLNIRCDMDDREQSPGWKFNEWEMKGVPIRIEIGPRDIENNQMIIVRRDTLEKQSLSLDAMDKIVTIVKAMWCGNRKCEDKIKEQTSASTRVIPFKEEKLETKCVCCGKKAKHMVYFAKSY